MKLLAGRFGALRVVVGTLFATWAVACGGAQPEPETPSSSDPVLEDEPEGVAEASSPEVQKGIDAIRAEDFETARTVLLDAVEKSPEDPQAVFYLGVAHAGLNEIEPAVQRMQRALELKPDFTEASINLSALLLDAGKSQDALDAADAGLKHAADDASLLQNRGLALFDLGNNEEAAKVLVKVVEKAPSNEELRFVYAQSLLGAGDEAGSLKQLDQLSTSSNVEVLASVADVFGRQKAWDQCIKTLDKAIGRQVEAELHVKRGLCKHGKSDEDGAKADFEKAIEIEPTSPKGYFYLGQNFKQRGDKKAARAALSKAAELDPDGKLGAAAKKAVGEL